MKKILFFATAMVLLAGVLAGCGGSQNELDFKSVRDTETGEIFSVGDTKDRVEEILGTGVSNEEDNQYTYLNELVTIAYDDEDKMAAIMVKTGTNRFEFMDIRFDMKSEDLAGNFTRSDGYSEEYSYYERYFDSTGKEVDSQDLAEYGASVTYYKSGTEDTGEIRDVSIGRKAKN